jgi:flagellar basal-body rod protein FlgB
MNNTKISQNTYNLIKNSMDVSVLRQKVISHNIANVNTKGYKKFDVVLDETLSNDANLKVADEKHIIANESSNDIKIVRDESSSMRKDGNNVDVDSEMMNLASNSMMYNALVSELNNRFSMTRYVIKGGK